MNEKCQYRIEKLDVSVRDFLEDMLYEAIYVKPCQEKLPWSIIHTPELKKYISEWSDDMDVGLIAIDIKNGKKIGAVWLKLLKDSNKGWGYISDTIPELSMAILPEYRGMGIGTILLEKIIEDNRQKYPQISLSVDPQNKAMKLYKKFGFRECGVAGTSVTMVLD
ncbi:MAG TPA: GNAT family N-acetyltransferase [Syntrophomonadaceae bacterium]|nr:GNAT family N-acetyltransferase [Syntrophomonadaceae bacterium]